VRAAVMVRRGSMVAGVALLAMGVAVSGCGILPQQGVVARPLTVLPSPKTQQITTVAVQQGPVINSLQVAGQIQPNQQALLYFVYKNGGKIKTLNMKNGDMVAKGQVLATLDPGNLPFQISQQQLTITQDQLHISDLANGLTLHPPTSAADAAARNSQLQQAQVQMKQHQLDLENLQIQLGQLQVRAPYAGKIDKMSKHIGDWANAYAPIAQISDTSDVHFVAKLDPATVTEVSPGQSVVLGLASDSQHKYTTTVNSVQVPTDAAAAIAKANDGFGGLTAPQVTLDIPTGYRQKADDIGGAFTAIITVDQRSNVLYLPNSGGIVTSFQGLNSVNLDVNGHIVQRKVTLGLQGNKYVEVTAGLQAGDMVVQP